MFIFEKRTQIPVCIRNKNPKLAGIILSQYGGLYSKRLYNKKPPRNRTKSEIRAVYFTLYNYITNSKTHDFEIFPHKTEPNGSIYYIF